MKKTEKEKYKDWVDDRDYQFDIESVDGLDRGEFDRRRDRYMKALREVTQRVLEDDSVPKPKFKVGDWVWLNRGSSIHIECKIKEIIWFKPFETAEGKWAYRFFRNCGIIDATERELTPYCREEPKSVGKQGKQKTIKPDKADVGDESDLRDCIRGLEGKVSDMERELALLRKTVEGLIEGKAKDGRKKK